MDTVTISPKYLELNKQLHDAPRGFGGDGDQHVGRVLKLAGTHNIKTMLDYGAGQGKLKYGLIKIIKNNPYYSNLSVTNYDPAVENYNQKPTGTFDLVTCTDVLEHIEPEYLNRVMLDIADYSHKIVMLLINFCPSNKLLPDGRNAHLSQHPAEVWEDYLSCYDWHLLHKEYFAGKKLKKPKKGLYILEKL